MWQEKRSWQFAGIEGRTSVLYHWELWPAARTTFYMYCISDTKCFKPEVLGLIPTFFRFHLIANIKQFLKLFLKEERRDIDQGKAAKKFINK